MSIAPEGAPAGRPLVSFALFAYNQEEYVREAIEGAFAQTYHPLEIILSDDCSKDRTYEIMQELAAAYTGPSRVRVRRNEVNIGIIDHFLSVAREASGVLFVVAAGDDIAYPDRVARLFEAWADGKPGALYSAADECDDAGRIIARAVVPKPLDRIQRLFEGCSTPIRYSGKVRNIPGYSAAYRTDIVAKLPFNGMKANNEDALMTYVINLNGERIEVLERPLMMRRISKKSISAQSTFQGMEDVIRNEIVIKSFSKSSIDFIYYFSKLKEFCSSEDFRVVLLRLENDIKYYNTISKFWDVELSQRIMLLFKSRSLKELKYILPRLFGIRFFSFLKFFLSRR